MGEENRGRPSKFNRLTRERLLSLYFQGATDEQAAQVIGVSERTIHNWKLSHPDFFQALKDAKKLADLNVQSSLYRRAIGASHPETKAFVDREGHEHKITYTKHHPPDTTACIFWLKNREPALWREKVEGPISQAGVIIGSPGFYEFCIESGYFPPFIQQVQIRDFLLRETEPRMLLGARGYGKTDYGVIMGLADEHVRLGKLAPSTLLVTKSPERNAAILREVQTAAEKKGVVYEVANSEELRVAGCTGKDNSLSAITIGTSSTRGRHPYRILMDDPVTPEDTSEAVRKRVKRLYEELHKLCSNIGIVGQPVHKYDLYQELRPLVKLLEMPYGTIPELDHDLEAQRLAGVSEESIRASYFLEVLNELTNPFDKVLYVPTLPTGPSVAFIDPSFEGGDLTALSVGKSHFDGIAVQGHVWKKAWYHCIEEIAARLIELKVQRVCFETNALGEQPLVALRQALPPSIGVCGRRSTNNKHSRIMAAGAYAHQIHLSRASDRQYLDGVVKYEYGSEPDDAPDSLASLLAWIGLIKGKDRAN